MVSGSGEDRRGQPPGDLNDGSKDATYKKYRIIRKIMTVLSESINQMKDMEEQYSGDIVTQ